MVSAGDEHNFGDLLDKTIDATGDLERNTSIYSLGLLPIKKIGRRLKIVARLLWNTQNKIFADFLSPTGREILGSDRIRQTLLFRNTGKQGVE